MADDKRNDDRSQVVLKIKFKSENLDQFIQRYSVDVSQGGIFIRTKKPLDVGQKLRFEFQLKDSSPLIMGEGVVMWTREKDPSRPDVAPGMGVKFEKLEGESRKTIETVLAEKKDADDERFGAAPAAAESNEFGGSSTKVAPADLLEQLAEQDENDSVVNSATKSTPFQSDAEDYSQDTFEEATRVASVDALMGLEEEAPSSPFVPIKETPFGKTPEPEPEPEPQPEPEPKFSDKADEDPIAAAKEPEFTKSERPKAATLPPEPVREEKTSSPIRMLLVLGTIAAGGYWLFMQLNKPKEILPPPVNTEEVAENTSPVETKTEKPTEAAPMKQRLMVDTIPQGAYIVVDGTALNKVTPVELNVVAESNKSIDVKRLGFQSKTVDLPKDPTQAAMKITLAPKPVTLSIKSKPTGAKVFINGSRKPGKTPMNLRITEATGDELKMTLKSKGMKDLEVPLGMSNFAEEDTQWKGAIELELRPEEKTAAPKPQVKKPAPKPAVKADAPKPEPNNKSSDTKTPVETAKIEKVEKAPAEPKAEQAPADKATEPPTSAPNE